MAAIEMKESLDFEIVHMKAEYYPQVAAIFAQGIETGNATYDTSSVNWAEWDAKHLEHSRWVVKHFQSSQILGWFALSGVSSRNVFTGVAEVSIYINTNFVGRGLGNVLMKKGIASSETNGIWMLQSGIFPENMGSIKLHEKHGFRLVGRRERLGKMADGRWRDIVLLEKRSSAVGID